MCWRAWTEKHFWAPSDCLGPTNYDWPFFLEWTNWDRFLSKLPGDSNSMFVRRKANSQKKHQFRKLLNSARTNVISISLMIWPKTRFLLIPKDSVQPLSIAIQSRTRIPVSENSWNSSTSTHFQFREMLITFAKKSWFFKQIDKIYWHLIESLNLHWALPSRDKLASAWNEIDATVEKPWFQWLAIWFE